MAKNSNFIEMPNEFAKLILVTQSHLGGNKISDKMQQYVFGQRSDMISIFDIQSTWEKFVLAARAIAGNKFPETICAVSGKSLGRKPVLKFSESIGCKPITSRFIPGSFTNTTVKGSIEPRLIIVSDPNFDKQAVSEASQVNCPVIAFCNTDATLSNIDIAIPVNNRSAKGLGVSFFILSKLVNFIKNGEALEDNLKNVELFFYRDASELESLLEEQNEEAEVKFAAAPQQDNTDFGKAQSEVESGSRW